MGGSGNQTSKTTSPQIPPYLLPILGSSSTDLMSALNGGTIPSLAGLFGGVPGLSVPGLTGQQTTDINALQGLGQSGGVFPFENQAAQWTTQARNQMGQIADPNVAKQAFEQFASPEVMQQSALAGQANSGAVPYALSQAAIPFELQNQQTELAAAQGQLGAAQQLGGLGQTQLSNQMNELTTALQAAGMPRDVAQQLAESQFNQQQQQWGFGKDLRTFPFSLYGPTIGGGSTSVSTGGKF